MRLKMIALALGLAMVLLLTILVSARSLSVEETTLTSSGKVYEVNRGQQESLFISDNSAREIWQVKASGAYTVYSLAIPPVDARTSQDKSIWWTDGASTFGRLQVPTNTVTTWDVEPDYNLRGITLDERGGVWLTHSFGPNLYRFEAGLSAGVLCTYTLPGGSYAEYVVADQERGEIWLAAWGEKRLFRLDPEAAANQLTYWQIPDASSFPVGVSLDGLGNLWWADSGLGALGRLEPALDLMTVYSLPVGSKPQMITVQGDQIWYTEFAAKVPGTVGRLDPDQATGPATILQATTTSVTPDCSDLEPSGTQSASTRGGQLSWTSGTAEPVYNQDGWTIYQQDPGYKPYGVAVHGGYLWAAVQEAQKLVRYDLSVSASLNLSVSPSVLSAYHGQSVHYTYTVTYTSSDSSPANTLVVQDDRCGPVNFIGGDDGDNQLDVDETWLYGCQRNVPAHIEGEANPMTNTVTALARDASGEALPPAVDGAQVRLLHREGVLGLLKDGPKSVRHGQTITYSYAISYTSPDNSPAANVSVTDDNCSPVTGPDAAGDDNGNGSLDVDELWIYACQITVPEHEPGEDNPLVNVGKARGQDLDGDVVTEGQDQHQVQIEHKFYIHLPAIMAQP